MGRLLISRLGGSRQAQDFTKPANCSGLGRLRHFRRTASTQGWPPNPLPIDPAAKFLGLPPGAEVVSQVFQNAACNWRCWYCFVPNELLEAREEFAAWMTADELLDLYLAEPAAVRPSMIDLTGGQPDLTPEWVLWMMQAIRRRGLEGRVFLWSDDNLSTDLFWRVLSEEQVREVSSFRGYGRVACFKGFDEESFTFNTSAASELYSQQFSLFDRMRRTGVDLYAYATLTAPTMTNIAERVRQFVDRLQTLHPNLPLRTVPLNIYPFGVVKERISSVRRFAALGNVPFDAQTKAVAVWQDELAKRFSSQQRTVPITDVTIT
ncbi:hypothetical protein [Anaeromyxobacter sp. PSR-1]|uniref:hypothetical protein n=1 Tax=unclassified Anaeromyxobacter TaxID=2620896 RepID=UPI001269CAB6|nr:hypothetical protein [Anaeromyxobacter sp. PSR-1]